MEKGAFDLRYAVPVFERVATTQYIYPSKKGVYFCRGFSNVFFCSNLTSLKIGLFYFTGTKKMTYKEGRKIKTTFFEESVNAQTDLF